MAETSTTTVQAPRDESTEVAQPPSRRKGIIIVVVVILVLVAVGFWWHSTYYEDTDDAQVNGHLIQISSRISGQVIKVNVAENQQVNKGDLIAELDPRDYQVAVENAKAALASAEAAAAAAKVNIPITSINTGSKLASAGADVSGGVGEHLAGSVANGCRACQGGPGGSEQCQSAGRPAALQTACREGRDQQAAI